MNDICAFQARSQRHLFCARYPQRASPFLGEHPLSASPFYGSAIPQNRKQNYQIPLKRQTDLGDDQRQRYWYKDIENKESGRWPLIRRNGSCDGRQACVRGRTLDLFNPRTHAILDRSKNGPRGTECRAESLPGCHTMFARSGDRAAIDRRSDTVPGSGGVQSCALVTAGLLVRGRRGNCDRQARDHDGMPRPSPVSVILTSMECSASDRSPEVRLHHRGDGDRGAVRDRPTRTLRRAKKIATLRRRPRHGLRRDPRSRRQTRRSLPR